MTPQEIAENNLFIDSVEKIYMKWSKKDLILEIFEFMTVEDYKKVLRSFSNIDEIREATEKIEEKMDGAYQ